MPAPYSDDLRQKAIAAVKRGEKKITVCRFLKVSRNTLDLWLKKEKETGSFRPLTPAKKGPKPKIKDLQKFREFVLKHPDKTQQQIAELWGDSLTQQNVSDACQKLGITCKKNLRPLRKK
jgi:transposase